MDCLANAGTHETGQPLSGLACAQLEKIQREAIPPCQLRAREWWRGALRKAKDRPLPPLHIPGQKTPSPELQPTRARSFFSTSSSMSTNTGAISYVYLPGQRTVRKGIQDRIDILTQRSPRKEATRKVQWDGRGWWGGPGEREREQAGIWRHENKVLSELKGKDSVVEMPRIRGEANTKPLLLNHRSHKPKSFVGCGEEGLGLTGWC